MENQDEKERLEKLIKKQNDTIMQRIKSKIEFLCENTHDIRAYHSETNTLT